MAEPCALIATRKHQPGVTKYTMNQELNKFELLGQATEGCRTGQHIIDEAEGHSTVERDGINTKIKMRCLVCRQQINFSAPFGLNDYINEQPEQSEQIRQSIQHLNPVGEEYMKQSDILRRILG